MIPESPTYRYFQSVKQSFTQSYHRPLPGFIAMAEDDLHHQAASSYTAQAWSFIIRGFESGLAGSSQKSSLAPLVSTETSLPRDLRLFLEGVRKGAIRAKGKLPPEAMQIADAFQHGIGETFPEGRDLELQALRLTARAWGKQSFAKKSSSARSLERATFSGRSIGTHLRSEWEMARVAALSASLLESSLHRRSIPLYLATCGWLYGAIEYTSILNQELNQLIRNNTASAIHTAFRHDDVYYATTFLKKTVEVYPEMETIAKELERQDKDVASVFRENIPTILSRTIHGARWDYASKVRAALPEIVEKLEASIKTLLADPNTARAGHALRANKNTVFSRCIQREQFDYDDVVVKGLPGLILEFDKMIKKLESSSPKQADFLKQNEKYLLYYAIQSGQFQASCIQSFLRKYGKGLK